MRLLKRIASAIVLLFVAGCTYDPPVVEVTVQNHARRGDSSTWAIVVKSEVVERPNGLAAWPDGGIARVHDQKAVVYLCDSDRSEIRRIAVLDAPPDMRTAFSPWIGRWERDDAFSISLRGERGPVTKAGAFHIRWFLMETSGDSEPVSEGPTSLPAATSLPGNCETLVREDSKRGG